MSYLLVFWVLIIPFTLLDTAEYHDSACIWINLEPCGLICGMMTWLLLGYGMGATTVRLSYRISFLYSHY